MILLTGATGIIGSQILLKLVQAGEKVRILVRPSSSLKAIEQLFEAHSVSTSLFEISNGDINDLVSLTEAMEDCHLVYHCAALVSFHPNDSSALFETNIKGTENVVNTCLLKGVKTLAYVSSTAAIGDELKNGEQTETSNWTTDKGKSAYALSKRYAELEVWRGGQEGLQITMVNPGVVIGPGKWGESSTTLLKSCKSGMMFYPSGSNAFVDARDVAEMLISCVEKALFNERYILIGEHLSFKQLFTDICTALGSSAPSIHMPKWPMDILSKLLEPLEFFGFTIGGITSKSLKTAYKNTRFSNQKAQGVGFKFRPIHDAIAYTARVQKQS